MANHWISSSNAIQWQTNYLNRWLWPINKKLHCNFTLPILTGRRDIRQRIMIINWLVHLCLESYTCLKSNYLNSHVVYLTNIRNGRTCISLAFQWQPHKLQGDQSKWIHERKNLKQKNLGDDKKEKHFVAWRKLDHWWIVSTYQVCCFVSQSHLKLQGSP